MAVEVTHDQEGRRFAVELDDGEEAYLAYRELDDGRLDFVSTFVPESARGRGLAERIVVRALEHARESGRRIVPTCPYVRHVVRERRPEYRDLVEEEGGGDG